MNFCRRHAFLFVLVAGLASHPVLAADDVPPRVLSVNYDNTDVEIRVSFSESVNSGADLAASFRVFETLDPARTIAVTGAVLADSVITLDLVRILLADTDHVLQVFGINDAAGNPVAPGTAVEFRTAPDLGEPRLILVATDPERRRLLLEFSEPMDPMIADPANYRLVQAGSGEIELRFGVMPTLTTAELGILDDPLDAGDYLLRTVDLRDAQGTPLADTTAAMSIYGKPPPGEGPVNPAHAVHLVPRLGPIDACDHPPDMACTGLLIQGEIETPYDVYILAMDRMDDTGGILGGSFSIRYNQDLGLMDWTPCGEVVEQSNSWPETENGVRIRFTECVVENYEGGQRAVLGSFYVYAYADAYLEILDGDIPRQVEDCLGVSLSGADVGHRGIRTEASFGNTYLDHAFNPCLRDWVPVRHSTWGQVKLLFRDPGGDLGRDP